MADFFAGGIGGGEGIGGFPLEQWFFETPVCTRWWTTATVITSVLVQCHVLTPFQLFYSYRAVFHKSQYWRLISTFLYVGPINLDLLFHIFFLQRYCRFLEESSGRSAAHFAWLMAYASITLLCIAPFFSIAFLGSALSSTLVYIWSRRNPDSLLSFLGLIVFRAPFLPWVLIAFGVIFSNTVPKDEVCGIAVGHVWYYFNDIYPRLHNDHRPLDPPQWWVRLFEGDPQEHGEEPTLDDLVPEANVDAATANQGDGNLRRRNPGEEEVPTDA
ncbi:ER membrane protein [Eremomyces bilateralis CBS 781.70]|uniref:Derlin n=1 Tax=Eremomyces bilateralis CBS 781.70 TaxID=1392243 RepID=A0A6G1G5I1_9PEZI|nr:ER membrane protein [Eremomyces bilateralis CBS 781.70]KAF1813262.1 ER membrane protein [Eremomyces bilateralis CBS 781.70]